MTAKVSSTTSTCCWPMNISCTSRRHARRVYETYALKERPGEYLQIGSMIGNLLMDHEIVIRQLRSDVDICADKYHDMGTSDFLTGLMERHEKMAWMLRAMLESGSK